MIVLAINAIIVGAMLSSVELGSGREMLRYWIMAIGALLLMNLNYIAGVKGWC